MHRFPLLTPPCGGLSADRVAKSESCLPLSWPKNIACNGLHTTTRLDEQDLTRFTNASLVGAYFGLTPRKYASGETDHTGSISKCGDKMTRSLLCEAANALMTRVQRWSWLKHWGVEIARRRGQMRAKIAVARRLAVIMHRMWIDGTTFRWTKDVPAEMSVA